jgi:hypothetical protein
LDSIDGVESNLHQFVTRILQQSLETDSRLRSIQSTMPTASATGTKAGAEIMRLAHAHRVLLEDKIKHEPTQLPQSKWIEGFYANNKGLIWVLGVVLTAIGLVWGFLHR